jgi:predicted proteasome-type protease
MGKPEYRGDRDAENARLFQAAQRVGRPSGKFMRWTEALEASEVKFDVSFLLGGQIKATSAALCLPAGNFIECTPDTRSQIGEHKYGKPRAAPLPTTSTFMMRCGRTGLGRLHHASISASACR